MSRLGGIVEAAIAQEVLGNVGSTFDPAVAAAEEGEIVPPRVDETTKLPASPSKARGVPACGLSETATCGPWRKEAMYCHEPVSSGAKRHFQILPLVPPAPLVSKKPGTS
jgi:hypothetical protein